MFILLCACLSRFDIVVVVIIIIIIIIITVIILVGRPEGKRPLGRPRRKERITLSWTLKRQGSTERAGFSWLRIESSGGLL
jgi:hypothetical protein